MNTNKRQYLIGSVSHATMRDEHLIPRFMALLEELADPKEVSELREEYAGVFEALEKDEELPEDSQYLMETLFNRLHDFALPYMYFGAHPGDGSDYGFWLCEGFEQDFLDNGGLKVSDMSEVPADYSGEVLHVNDHGNPTLYSAENGKLTEIWALV